MNAAALLVVQLIVGDPVWTPSCSSDTDCSLLGVCTNGACKCDPGKIIYRIYFMYSLFFSLHFFPSSCCLFLHPKHLRAFLLPRGTARSLFPCACVWFNRSLPLALWPPKKKTPQDGKVQIAASLIWCQWCVAVATTWPEQRQQCLRGVPTFSLHLQEATPGTCTWRTTFLPPILLLCRGNPASVSSR